MLITANLGVIYLVVNQGRWEAVGAIPFLAVAWLVLWLTGRKKVMREEVDYNWQLSKSWKRHEAATIDAMERLERLERLLDTPTVRSERWEK